MQYIVCLYISGRATEETLQPEVAPRQGEGLEAGDGPAGDEGGLAAVAEPGGRCADTCELYILSHRHCTNAPRSNVKHFQIILMIIMEVLFTYF